MDICPPYFTGIELECQEPNQVLDWIYENLSGRFYAGPVQRGSLIDQLTEQFYLFSFEQAAEATLFALHLQNFK